MFARSAQYVGRRCGGIFLSPGIGVGFRQERFISNSSLDDGADLVKDVEVLRSDHGRSGSASFDEIRMISMDLEKRAGEFAPHNKKPEKPAAYEKNIIDEIRKALKELEEENIDRKRKVLKELEKYKKPEKPAAYEKNEIDEIRKALKELDI